MPGPLVIDAGLTLRVLLPDVEQQRARDLVDGWQREGRPLLAPSLWLYEVTSTLTRAVHGKVLTAAEGGQALALALQMKVQLLLPDAALAAAAYDWTIRLGRAAAYDSFYLVLAETLACELWTVDRRLVAAANVSWVRGLDTPA